MKSFAHPRVVERGILTSAYKQEIKNNARYMKRKSISQIKSTFKARHNKLTSETGTILQVSLFTLVLVVLFI